MLNQKVKYHTLPKLQNRIVLCLAKHGPMNIRETNKKLRGEYTSTNRAFHELEKKQFVEKVLTQKYRGRKFSKYWLSDRGLVYAILHGSNLNVLSVYVKNVYPDDDAKAVLIVLAKILGPKAFRYATGLIYEKGLTAKSVSILIGTGVWYARQFTNEKPKALKRKVEEALKPYPKIYSFYTQIKREMREMLS